MHGVDLEALILVLLPRFLEDVGLEGALRLIEKICGRLHEGSRMGPTLTAIV